MAFNWLFNTFKKTEYQSVLTSAGNTDKPTKEFSSDLESFAQRLDKNQAFAFARFNDGEMKILFGEKFDLAKNRIGNTYLPQEEAGEKHRRLLVESFKFRSPGYYVGIVCPCCEEKEDFYRMKALSGQREKNLTWANVFVNSNFPLFKTRITPLFNTRKIVFVGNSLADPNGLPFKIVKKFEIGDNAWVNDYSRLLVEITDYIEKETLSDAVFIFCAGVLSNLLIYKLYEKFPDNTYLDLGSVYDVELGLGKSRRYLRKGRTLAKTCIWA